MNLDLLKETEGFTGIVIAQSECKYYAIEWNGGNIMNVWFYNGEKNEWFEVDVFTDNRIFELKALAEKSAGEWLNENIL